MASVEASRSVRESLWNSLRNSLRNSLSEWATVRSTAAGRRGYRPGVSLAALAVLGVTFLASFIGAVVVTEAPAAASSASIGQVNCGSGSGEIFATVTNDTNEDLYFQLRINDPATGAQVGNLVTGFWVGADSSGSQSVSGIPNGTYDVAVIWGRPPFVSYIAIEPRTFTCVVEQPLARPTVSTSVSASTLYFSWLGVSGATSYDYRITDDGAQVRNVTGQTRLSHTYGLGSRYGRICVYVTARAAGRSPSSQGSSCKTVANPQRLATPNVSSSVSGSTLSATWASVPGATSYTYQITDDGAQVGSARTQAGRSISQSLGSRYGRICVSVTAKAAGRTSSLAGSRCLNVANRTPLARPTVSTAVSGSTLSFSWGAVSGATSYDYRVTDDGAQVRNVSGQTRRTHTYSLGSRHGRICVYVTAKATGRVASSQGSSCKTVTNPTPLSTPTVSTSVSNTTFSASWAAVSGATKYDYYFTDDGARFSSGTNLTARSVAQALGTRHGRICVYVTAKATGRTSSARGSTCRTVSNPTPLPRPSVSTSVSGSTLSFSWNAVSGATRYDYRITDDGTQFTQRVNQTGRSFSVALGNRTGNICVYVTAKASGRQSSAETARCRTIVNTTPLATPTVSTSVSGSTLYLSWQAVPGATKYNYRITDDGYTARSVVGQTGRTFTYSIGSRTGNLCVYVTATAPGRVSSARGSSCETVVDNTPLASPVVSSSLSGTTFTFSWPAVSGADKYDYTITDDGRYVYSLGGTRSRSFSRDVSNLTGEVCVRVSAKASGRPTSAAAVSCKTVVNPSPLDAPNVSTSVSGSTLYLSWPAVPGATRYDYRITDDGADIRTLLNQSGRSFNYSLGSRSGTICVHVTAKAPGRVSSTEAMSCKP